MKLPIVATSSLLVIPALTWGSDVRAQSVSDAYLQGVKLQIELRKVQVEEHRLYLETLQRSKITEEKAREVSASILNGLKDYPPGNKAKHRAEDVDFLTETISTISKAK